MDPETSNDGLPRFSPVAFNDHTEQLCIVIILSLVYTALVATAGAYIKYMMFGFDDILIALAVVFHLAQSITLFVGSNSNLGKFNSITPTEQWAASSKSTLAAVILCLLALSLAKCSLLALILRIISSSSGKSKPICIGLMIISGAWGIGSSVAFLVNCRAPTLLAVDNVKQCPNQAMIGWSLISATVPNPRNFLKSFSIGMGFPLPVDPSMYGSSNVYALRSLESNRSRSTSSAPAAATVASTFIIVHDHYDSNRCAQPQDWRPDKVLNQTRVVHYFSSNNRQIPSEIEEGSRTGNQEMIVNKEVAWNITYGDHH
ncbi:hypothetical protein BGZ63DRAFT_429269 [Mariannaea sp. PMI_226]|nr:hypothetical protein BGZ63DRAFT_429269 [Mariannaea sp. PMI_226]